jgi:hypothetical protein
VATVHVFTLILDSTEDSDADADALYDACDDAVYGSSNGYVHVHFERPGDDVMAVIRQAIADVENALPHVRVIRAMDRVGPRVTRWRRMSRARPCLSPTAACRLTW